MTDQTRNPDTDLHTGVRPDRASSTGTPRWLKVTAIAALVLAIIALALSLLVAIMLFTGGEVGPSLWDH